MTTEEQEALLLIVCFGSCTFASCIIQCISPFIKQACKPVSDFFTNCSRTAAVAPLPEDFLVNGNVNDVPAAL